jgi:hypothetical protein
VPVALLAVAALMYVLGCLLPVRPGKENRVQ